jgi:DNA helicase IV
MSIIRKRIREKFDIKLSQVYKHFWYLSAYSRYLIYGNTETSKRTHIFIDEAQDLSAMEIELIRKINTPAEKQKSHLPVMNIFGDTNQMISKHGVGRWGDINYISDEFMLDENFRNTNQVVDYCNNKLKLNIQINRIAEILIVVFIIITLSILSSMLSYDYIIP